METKTKSGQKDPQNTVTETREAILKSMEKLVTNYNAVVSKAISAESAFPSQTVSANQDSCT
jgi:hypothetical protein